MKRLQALVGLLCLSALSALSQNEVDALRFSNTQVPGTARSLGMGGAFGALGADMSSFWINPGGIGLFRRGGLEMTLAVSDQTARSVYEGDTYRDGRTNLTIQSIGLNSTRQIENSSWKSYTVGFAHGKQQNFHERVRISGSAMNATLLSVFAAQANGTSPGDLITEFPFGAGLAWEAYAIDPLDPDALTYKPAAGNGEVLQDKRMNRSGSMSETAFAMGGNYEDWLYVGGSVSFHGISFSEEANYGERFFQSTDLSSFRFREDLRVSGTGVGLKLGTVIRATPWLRLGAAWHSRIRYGLTDTYSAEMRSSFLTGPDEGYESPINVSSYSLRAPARAVLSAAFILGNAGVVSADYEYTNFSGIRMSGTQLNNYDFAAENETIEAIYRGTHKVRAGVELRAAESWRVRFGSQYAQSPFARGVNSNSSQLTYSIGGGYRYNAFFADIAALYIRRSEDYFLFDPAVVSAASIRTDRVAIMISGGLRF